MAEIYIKMVELVKLVGHKRGMILRMMNKNDAAAYDPVFRSLFQSDAGRKRGAKVILTVGYLNGK